MISGTLLPLCVLLGVGWAIDFNTLLPTGQDCDLRYNKVFINHDWVCKESQFQMYPGQKVDRLLRDPMYYDVGQYLNVTRSCHHFNDHHDIFGENEHYTYESICRMQRRPVRVIWAKVPGYMVPPQLATLNNGLLPCHVLEGQSLFDIDCVHPWADINWKMSAPKHLPIAMISRLERIQFDGAKRHLCLIGYAYNNNMMCKPTGYVTREVVVYSEHADRIFSVVIPNVPTSCQCATCDCIKGGMGGGVPPFVV